MMTAIDLSNQQALDADTRGIQQINFNGNLDQAKGAFVFFILEEAKETFGLFTRNFKSVVNGLYNNLIWFNVISI